MRDQLSLHAVPFRPINRLFFCAYALLLTCLLELFLEWFADGKPAGKCRWYKVLDKTVMPNNSRSTAAVLLKTAADQVIWAPIMTVVFFAVLKSLEGHPELIWSTVQVRQQQHFHAGPVPSCRDQ